MATKKATPVVEAEAPAPDSSVLKTTINLTQEYSNAVKDLAAARGTSVNEIIRRAILLEKFLYEAIKNGGKVYVEKPNEPRTEIFIR